MKYKAPKNCIIVRFFMENKTLEFKEIHMSTGWKDGDIDFLLGPVETTLDSFFGRETLHKPKVEFPDLEQYFVDGFSVNGNGVEWKVQLLDITKGTREIQSSDQWL